MALDFWAGLNVGVDFDQDEKDSYLDIIFDHDELKGDLRADFRAMLEEFLDDEFETAENAEAVTDNVIPKFEAMKEHFESCLKLITDKIEEAKGFVDETDE